MLLRFFCPHCQQLQNCHSISKGYFTRIQCDVCKQLLTEPVFIHHSSTLNTLYPHQQIFKQHQESIDFSIPPWDIHSIWLNAKLPPSIQHQSNQTPNLSLNLPLPDSLSKHSKPIASPITKTADPPILETPPQQKIDRILFLSKKSSSASKNINYGPITAHQLQQHDFYAKQKSSQTLNHSQVFNHKKPYLLFFIKAMIMLLTLLIFLLFIFLLIKN